MLKLWQRIADIETSIPIALLDRLGSRVWRSPSQRVITVTGIGMLLALLADILIAARFGATVIADAIIIAISFPRLIETVSREGTKFSLTALFVEEERQRTEIEFHNYANGILNLFLIIGLALMVVSWIFAPQLMIVFGAGLPDEMRALSAVLMRLSLPIMVFALGATVLGVLLNSREHFVIVATRNMAIPGLIIVAMLAAWNNLELLPKLIAAAHAVAYFIYFLVLWMYARQKLQLRLDIRQWPRWSATRSLAVAVLYPTAGLTVNQGARVLERSIATLVAPGGASAYYFAARLVSALQSIIGVSIAITGLPSLTRHKLDEYRGAFLRRLRRQVTYVVLISVPLAISVAIFAPIIIEMLYARGNFDTSAASSTSQVLRFLAPAILFLSIAPVLNSSLYAQKRYAWILLNLIFLSSFSVGFAWLLSRQLGLVGIAISVVLTSLINVFNLYMLNRLSIQGYDTRVAEE